MKKLLLLLALSLAVFGCKTTPLAKPTVTPKEAAVLVTANAAVAKADATATLASAAAVAKTDERDAKVKANVTAAQEWNTQNPEGNPKFGVDSELTVALNSFSDVVIDPVEQAAAATRRALIETGKATEARAAYAKANTQAQALSAEVIRVATVADQANAARDAAVAAEKKGIETHNAQLTQNLKDNQAVIDKIKEDAKTGVLHQQARWLTLLGVASLLAFGISIWIAGMTGSVLGGAKSAWPFALFAVVCFGLAQLVSQPWFMYAVLGGLVLVVGLAVWWAVKQHRLAVAKAAAEQKTAVVTSALSHVVPVLDTAYNDSTEEGKKVMDATIFDKLNGNMDKADKAAIHDVRSTLATGATPATTGAPVA